MSLTRARISLCLFVLLCSFIWIRVFSADHVFMLRFADDDGGYYAYAEAIFDTQTLNWCDDGFSKLPTLKMGCTEGKPRLNVYTPGPALVMSPILLGGKILEWVGIRFGHETLPNTLFWWTVGTYLAALATVLLLFESTRLILRNTKHSTKTSFFLTLFYFLGHFVTFYFFRRPMMAHAIEFFLLSLTAFFCLRLYFARGNSWQAILGLSGSVYFLMLTRIDDIFIAFAIGLVLLTANYSRKCKIRNIAVYAGICLLSFATYFLVKIGQTGQLSLSTTDYNATFTLSTLFGFHISNIRRIFDFYAGPHWGIALLSPVYLYEIAFIALKGRTVFHYCQKNVLPVCLAVLVFIVHLNLIANIPNPLSYGYRFLLGNFLAIHLLFLFLLRTSPAHFRFSYRKALYVFASFIGLMNMINFHSNQSNLTFTMNRRYDAGVYSPKFRDGVVLDAPNYALHSLKHTFSLRAFKNIGASPIVAYPYSLLPESSKNASLLRKLHEYYASSKRKIYSWRDLNVLVAYHFWALLLTLAVVCFFVLRREKHSSIHDHTG